LNTVKISWALMQDEKQLDSGSTSVSGLPHAVGWLEIPTTALKNTPAGTTDYLRLTFLRPDGSEIAARVVELAPPPQPVPPQSPQKIVVKQNGNATVSVGQTSYSFDPKTGQLVSAAGNGSTLITGSRPTIWRPLTTSESGIARHEPGLTGVKIPDYDKFTAVATNWKVNQQPDKVTIHTEVLCTIDDKNRFTATLDYAIDAAGALTIDYKLAPELQVHWVSQVGLSFEFSPAFKALRWFGLEPLDTFPNENMAGVLGVYSGSVGSESIEGNKTTRWIEISGASGALRFQNRGYMRLDSKQPQQLQLLSAVLGRTSKGRRPEDPDQQLNIDPRKPFVGELSMQFVPH
jgi:beta-galactosidase